MDFTPIPKKRLSESAIEQIKDFIHHNKLETGSRLPSERELGSRLHISRSSIREALRMLEIMGLVEVKPGKGIYVRNPNGDLFVSLPIWVSNHKDAIHKHFEARLILEPEIAALAARRATSEYIDQIEQNIQNQKNLTDNEKVAIIQADIEFHRLVAEAAKNETILMLFNSIARISFHGWKAALRMDGRNESAVKEHTTLIKKIKMHDENGARKAMCEHMLASIHMLEQQGFVLDQE